MDEIMHHRAEILERFDTNKHCGFNHGFISGCGLWISQPSTVPCASVSKYGSPERKTVKFRPWGLVILRLALQPCPCLDSTYKYSANQGMEWCAAEPNRNRVSLRSKFWESCFHWNTEALGEVQAHPKSELFKTPGQSLLTLYTRKSQAVNSCLSRFSKQPHHGKTTPKQ